MSGSHSRARVLLVRLITLLLALPVVGAWLLVSLDVDAKPKWLTIEAALGITGGAVGLVLVILLISKLTRSKEADFGPPRPR